MITGYVLTANFTVKAINGVQHPTRPDHIKVGGKKWHKDDVYTTAAEACAAGAARLKAQTVALRNRQMELARRTTNLAESSFAFGI